MPLLGIIKKEMERRQQPSLELKSTPWPSFSTDVGIDWNK